jgi:hypothetical protein
VRNDDELKKLLSFLTRKKDDGERCVLPLERCGGQEGGRHECGPYRDLPVINCIIDKKSVEREKEFF